MVNVNRNATSGGAGEGLAGMIRTQCSHLGDLAAGRAIREVTASNHNIHFREPWEHINTIFRRRCILTVDMPSTPRRESSRGNARGGGFVRRQVSVEEIHRRSPSPSIEKSVAIGFQNIKLEMETYRRLGGQYK